MATCNLCGGSEFKEFRGRPAAQCKRCYSLERHRVCFKVYEQVGIFAASTQKRNLLHLAPERLLTKSLLSNPSINYLMSDPRTQGYEWARLLRLFLPNDFKIFSDGYFDFIIHNHVLEHIPGHWRDHLSEFKRLLAKGGKMIFTIPGPAMSKLTEEGGEHFSSDAERLAKFGQEDHVRLFGKDLISFLEREPGMNFTFDGLSAIEREKLGVNPGSNRVLIWSKI